ncbi:hypothetical protein [Ferroglobus sp.]|uniref:hypothetical protein n=1 Tax=Ferroglobus sp. TaxID=2614230 RepID=UPI0025C6DD11|nr:hypothetical protein [Ferroglobus sp.]
MITLVNVMTPEGGFSATTTIGLTWGGIYATAFLILLLSIKEILSASSYYGKEVESALNAQILPILFVFFAIVLFKTVEVLYP